MTRKYTRKLLEWMDEGIMDPKSIVEMCLSYMSEDDVKDMCQANDIEFFEDIEDEDEDQ